MFWKLYILISDFFLRFFFLLINIVFFFSKYHLLNFLLSFFWEYKPVLLLDIHVNMTIYNLSLPLP